MIYLILHMLFYRFHDSLWNFHEPSFTPEIEALMRKEKRVHVIATGTALVGMIGATVTFLVLVLRREFLT